MTLFPEEPSYLSSALCRPLWTPASRTCHSMHFPSFPRPFRLVWNHLLHTSALCEGSIFLNFPGSWRGPSAFPRLIHKARPRQPLPDQLQACTKAAMVDRPFFTWKGKICGPILPVVKPGSLEPNTGQKPAQCSFLCLTLTLLCVPQALSEPLPTSQPEPSSSFQILIPALHQNPSIFFLSSQDRGQVSKHVPKGPTRPGAFRLLQHHVLTPPLYPCSCTHFTPLIIL